MQCVYERDREPKPTNEKEKEEKKLHEVRWDRVSERCGYKMEREREFNVE